MKSLMISIRAKKRTRTSTGVTPLAPQDDVLSENSANIEFSDSETQANWGVFGTRLVTVTNSEPILWDPLRPLAKGGKSTSTRAERRSL